MEKIGKPLDLIGYDSVNSAKAKQQGIFIKKRFWQFKTVLFLAIFILVVMITIISLINKAPLKFSVLTDRVVLFTKLPDGSIRNSYVVKVFNKESKAKRLRLTVQGIENISIKTSDLNQYVESIEFDLKPEAQKEINLFVKVLELKNLDGRENIILTIQDLESNYKMSHDSIFVGPK